MMLWLVSSIYSAIYPFSEKESNENENEYNYHWLYDAAWNISSHLPCNTTYQVQIQVNSSMLVWRRIHWLLFCGARGMIQQALCTQGTPRWFRKVVTCFLTSWFCAAVGAFANSVLINSNGFTGGIVLGWRVICVSLVLSHRWPTYSETEHHLLMH